MQAHTKVSVLIPVFNRESYVAECIESALNQTYRNIEIIVVDNCSSDETWRICKEYESIDSRIKVYRNPINIGPVGNWLRCAEIASGEYSKILFSDDKLHPECVELMLKDLVNDDVGFVYSTAKIGRSEDESLVAYANQARQLIKSSEYLELLKKGRAPYSPGAFLIRTKDLLSSLMHGIDSKCKHEYWKHGAGPDLMISLLALKNYKSIKHIDRPLVFFRSHEKSFSVQNINNEIQYSYWSTLSLYLKQNSNRKNWIAYLAYTWLLDSWRLKRLTAPATHIKNYEGKGTLDEIVFMFCFAGIIITKNLLKKVK